MHVFEHILVSGILSRSLFLVVSITIASYKAHLDIIDKSSSSIQV